MEVPPAKKLKTGWIGKVFYCSHGRIERRCRDCQNEIKCGHGQIFHLCVECNTGPESGGAFCEHNRVRSQCKECGGSSICRHNRRRSTCKECGGSSICEHNRVRSQCKECGGSQVCEHGRQRSHCLPCGGTTALKKEAEREAKKELVERWVRDAHLREKHLDAVAAEQQDRCAGFWTCEEVEDGEPINQCQWGQKKVPKWAQQLDHIVPYAETQDDSRENLQMMCACCHAGKTAAERGAKSVGTAVAEV